MKRFKFFIYGVLMGAGELIPGVGAQTAAIISGFYDEVIMFLYNGTELLKNIFLWIIRKRAFTDVKKSFFAIKWTNWVILTIGSAVTLLIGAKIMHFVLGKYPLYVFAAAFGIVLACVQIPFQEMKKRGTGEIIVFLTTLIAFLIFFDQKPGALGGNITPLSMFVTGLISSLAGFFPGISISFSLLVFGVYDYLLAAADKLVPFQLNMPTITNLLAYALGLNIGLVVTIRTLKVLFERYQSYLLAFILGLIVASLRAVWPFMDVNSSTDPEMMRKLTPLGLPLWQSALIIVITFVTFMGVSMLRQYAMKREGKKSSSFGFSEILKGEENQKSDSRKNGKGMKLRTKKKKSAKSSVEKK